MIRESEGRGIVGIGHALMDGGRPDDSSLLVADGEDGYRG